jgi:hypothetical protein
VNEGVATLANSVCSLLTRTNHEAARRRKRQFRLDGSDWTASRLLGTDRLLDHAHSRLEGIWRR